MTVALMSVFLGAVIGLSLGLLGGGGSILTVPALVYIIGLPVAEATGTSLAIVGVTAMIGAVGHYRAGRVATRQAFGFGGASIIGSVAGSLLSKHVDGQLLLALFAFLMIAAGLAMLRGRKATKRVAAPHGLSGLARVAGAGVGVGLLTGFFGVGGGFVIVPALTLIIGLPMAMAIGTSLVVIAIASAAGLATHLGAGALDPAVTGFFVLGGLIGTIAGSSLAGRVPEQFLRRGFATLVFILAAYLLMQNYAALSALA